MSNLNTFIAHSVKLRVVSMFAGDIEANMDKLTQEIKGKKVCVNGELAPSVRHLSRQFCVSLPSVW